MNDQQEPLSDETAEAAPPPREPFDPYDGSRHMPWMDRGLSPSARAMQRLRPELASFAAIEGREPNRADIDAMSQRISTDMVEILRREWATDVVNEWFEERDAAREGRPVDPSIGPQARPVGGDPRDTRPVVFVAEPEDIDWVMERLGRRGTFGRRQKLPPRPGMKPFPPPPPIPLPESTLQPQPGGSLMTPADPDTPSSPPPFTAPEPTPPLPPTSASKLAPLFEAIIPPELKGIFRPIPGTEAIAGGGVSPILPGPLIGDPGLQIPVHILSVLWGWKEDKVRMVSGLIDPDKLNELYPIYGELEELAREAGRIVGPGKGGVHGSHIHHELTKLIKARYEKMETEVSFDPATGQGTRYGAKGSMRIDIIYDDGKTVYIFELKTGGAALKEPRIDRTLNLKKFEGRKVIVMELNPWRLPRK